MDRDELREHRRARLQAAVDYKTGGNKTHFGKLLGYSSGAFVRQMLAGEKEVTEKTVMQVEALPGLDNWFSTSTGPREMTERERFLEAFDQLPELTRREITEWTIKAAEQLRTTALFLQSAPGGSKTMTRLEFGRPGASQEQAQYQDALRELQQGFQSGGVPEADPPKPSRPQAQESKPARPRKQT